MFETCVATTIRCDMQVISDGQHARADDRRATEVAVAVHVLCRMADFGRPDLQPSSTNPDGDGLPWFIRPIYPIRRPKRLMTAASDQT